MKVTEAIEIINHMKKCNKPSCKKKWMVFKRGTNLKEAD